MKLAKRNRLVGIFFRIVAQNENRMALFASFSLLLAATHADLLQQQEMGCKKKRKWNLGREEALRFVSLLT